MIDQAGSDLISLTTEIVAAYVGKNAVSAGDLPALIATVHRALSETTGGGRTTPAEPLIPAVPIKKSITPDFIISLEDGRRFKSMKRHLAIKGMTPNEYRAKWGLPQDYPMVSPNYAAQRSALAKDLGLGQGGRKSSAKSQRRN